MIKNFSDCAGFQDSDDDFQSSATVRTMFDVDTWIYHYNHDRTHSGKHCFGKTPMQTMKDSIPLALAKQLN